MGFDVSFPDSLEKYGLFGALVFVALAAGAAIFWSALIGAIEAYQKQRRKRIKAVLFRPLATSVLFFVPLIAAFFIVGSTKADLRRAAEILDGSWRARSLGCDDARRLQVESDLGVLIIQTRDGFRFVNDFEAIDTNFVQVRQRGSLQPTIYERHNNMMLERFLDGTTRELLRC